MKKKLVYGVSLLSALLLGPIIAWAQQEVIVTGQDSDANTRILRTDSSGRVITTGDTGSSSTGDVEATHGACTDTTMNVGTTGTACPATARASRRTIAIQLVQAGETLTITTDGATTATATAGFQIGNTDVFADNLAGSVAASCRCTAATCGVRIKECP